MSVEKWIHGVCHLEDWFVVCGVLLFPLLSEFLQLSAPVMSRPDVELLSPQIREVWLWGRTAGDGTRAAEGSGDLANMFTRVPYSNKRAVWSETQTSARSLMSQRSRTITLYIQRPVNLQSVFWKEAFTTECLLVWNQKVVFLLG